MRSKVSVLLVAALWWGGSAAQQSYPAAADIVSMVQAELDAAQIPGAGIAVVSGDETLARAHGVASLETGTVMDAQTLLQIGSLTKLLTALAISVALDSRGVPATAAVGGHMPGLAPRVAQATFQQLLSHTSGLKERTAEYGADAESALAAGARALTDADFLFPGGAVFSYSNLGYALAGAVFERMRGQPYADAMRDVLFRPLGMVKTTVRPSEAMGRPYAVGHRIEGGKPVQVRIANDAALWPAGYAWSNAAEMTRLLSALVNGGRVYSKTSIPVAAIGAVTTPRVPMPNVFVGGQYGHGMMIARDREVLMYEHGGTMPGFSSILRIAPGRRLGIAVLTNVENAPLRRLAQNVMAKVLGLPAATPPVRDERAVTAEEMKPFIGMFRNHGTAEIAVADTGVTLSLDGGPAMAVTRIGDDRFLARPKPDVAGPEFVLKPATSSTPAYLHLALWAYVKDR